MTRLVNLGVAAMIFDQHKVRKGKLTRSVLVRAGSQSQYLPALTSTVQSLEVSYAFKSVQEYVSHNL
jgi:hypothetical protein